MELSDMLQDMVDKEASDLFLSVGAPPYLKIEGQFLPMSSDKLEPNDVSRLVYSILDDDKKQLFNATSELNMALRLKNVGRFRVNVFRQMGEIALVARHVKSEILSIEQLGLPLLLKDLIMGNRGLVLLVGGTGTGKSTTLASMLDYRNHHKTGHILTIEDPVEYVHEHHQSLVNQREVGMDTESYAVALKNAMREAPDVIMIGEIRDTDTMKSAIAYAETGHLCVSTLHANNATQAIDRILNFFPEDAHHQILQDLSFNLRAIVSQVLPRGVDGKRMAAVEVMLSTPYIAELIRLGELEKIKDAMIQAHAQGSQTFDQALFELVQAGKLDKEEALRYADSKTNLSLRFRLELHGTQSRVNIKKDVSYAHFNDFSEYRSYYLKRGNNLEDAGDNLTQFEEAIRQALFKKYIAERDSVGDVDLVIQYSFSKRQLAAAGLGDIEKPVSSQINIDEACREHGALWISIIDTHTGKTVWQVKAPKDIVMQSRPQEAINRDVEFLLSEFPPKAEDAGNARASLMIT